MPLFNYACSECLYCKEDVLEPVSENDTKVCPSCNKKTFDRLAPISHFQLSGYSYKNGYSNNSGH